MRALFGLAIALVTVLPSTAKATDYLYTFTGVVSFANNSDATDIYANEGDPINFSLLVRDSFRLVTYSYGSTGSSAVGGPDYAAGTLFPVDRTVTIDPALGYASDFTPLVTGYRPDENYSASISKDAATKSLALSMNFVREIPESPFCRERCSGTRIIHSASALVFSDGFNSPDFREVGSFALTAASTGTLGDAYQNYFGFGDFYEISLSRLTVERLPPRRPRNRDVGDVNYRAWDGGRNYANSLAENEQVVRRLRLIVGGV